MNFTINKDIDLIAFTAFLLSLGLSLIQIKGCLIGPKIDFVRPKVITISPITYPTGTYYQISAVMSYLNSGAKDQDDIITDEQIILCINKDEYLFTCHSTGDTKENNGELDIPNEKGAAPVSVPAGRSVTHESHFVIFPDTSEYLTEDKIKNYNSSGFDINIIFKFKLLRKRIEPVKSKISITKEHLKRLLKKKYISIQFKDEQTGGA